MAGTKKTTKAANTTRAAKAEQHKDAAAARKSDQQLLKAAYVNRDGEIILADILKKIKLWQKMHIKVAQDGMGSRPTGYKLEDGSQEVENIYLTPEQRASYLDKAAGLQGMLDYIERQTAVPTADVQPEDIEESEEEPEKSE